MAIFVEDWAVAYGSPYLVKPEDCDGTIELAEDGGTLIFHPPDDVALPEQIAFVDGVRRGEATLYQTLEDSRPARGIAGAHACGAVIAGANRRPEFAEVRTNRLAIWGSGATGAIPPMRGGWSWMSCSIASADPDAPLQELQVRMREEEGALAEHLAARGWLVVIDGPLNFVRSRDLPVVGYVKTHHRALLAPDLHARIPSLVPGQRSSLFAKRDVSYSCYLRVAAGTPLAGPWAGIVRLEIPQSVGLAAAAQAADRAAALLPRYAGVLHTDPRAPQNLQPVSALEKHLRHQLGDAGLAVRALREAVDSMPKEATRV